jgi:hypothetical protein
LERSDLPPPDLLALAERLVERRRRAAQAATADVFAPAEIRFSEEDRAILGGMAGQLSAELDAALRSAILADAEASAGLPADAVHRLGEAAQAPGAGTPPLRSPALAALLAVRMRSHALAQALQHEAEGGARGQVEALAAGRSAAVARAARDLLVAEAAAVDRFRRPRLGIGELPAELLAEAAWAAAARLRERLAAEAAVDDAVLDRALARGVLALTGRPPAEPTLGTASARLAEALAEERSLAVATAAGLLEEGRVEAMAAALALLADVPQDTVRDAVLDADGRLLAMVCRAAGARPPEHARIAATLARARRQAAAAADSLADFYAAIDEAGLARVLACWRRHPRLTAAMAALAGEG